MYAVALHTDMQYDCNSYAVILQHVAVALQNTCSKNANKMQSSNTHIDITEYPK